MKPHFMSLSNIPGCREVNRLGFLSTVLAWCHGVKTKHSKHVGKVLRMTGAANSRSMTNLNHVQSNASKGHHNICIVVLTKQTARD